MMRGFSWFGNGFCSFGFGSHFGLWQYSIWHSLLLTGLVFIIIAAIVVIAIVLIRKRKTGSDHSDDTLELLKRMYVNEELTEEEYLRKRIFLKGNSNV